MPVLSCHLWSLPPVPTLPQTYSASEVLWMGGAKWGGEWEEGKWSKHSTKSPLPYFRDWILFLDPPLILCCSGNVTFFTCLCLCINKTWADAPVSVPKHRHTHHTGAHITHAHTHTPQHLLWGGLCGLNDPGPAFPMESAAYRSILQDALQEFCCLLYFLLGFQFFLSVNIIISQWKKG